MPGKNDRIARGPQGWKNERGQSEGTGFSRFISFLL